MIEKLARLIRFIPQALIVLVASHVSIASAVTVSDCPVGDHANTNQVSASSNTEICIAAIQSESLPLLDQSWFKLNALRSISERSRQTQEMLAEQTKDNR